MEDIISVQNKWNDSILLDNRMELTKDMKNTVNFQKLHHTNVVLLGGDNNVLL